MGNHTKEIISLQIGNYANYVGTHWWNIQESGFNYTEDGEINHDVLFREGKNYNNQITYTPRLILVDVNNNFKTLPVNDPILYPEEPTNLGMII